MLEMNVHVAFLGLFSDLVFHVLQARHLVLLLLWLLRGRCGLLQLDLDARGRFLLDRFDRPRSGLL
jgi:hypothetical protein